MRSVSLIPLALVALAACAPSTGPSTGDDSLGFDPETTAPSIDLAPSQIAASTVPRPVTPPPCAADDLTWWTAQVLIGEVTAGAVLRVRNDGDDWCEADVGASRWIDPAIEPDVWLESGEGADLVIGQRVTDCVTPFLESVVDLDVNGESVLVPTALVTCGWWLAAFLPTDRAVGPCGPEDLDLVVAAGALVIRNSSEQPCDLGRLVALEGMETLDGTTPRGETATAEVEITALSGGDIVSFDLQAHGGTTCSDGPVTLRFDVAGEIPMPDLDGCSRVALGAAQPWFGESSDRLTGSTDVGSGVLHALDPFFAAA